MSIKQKEIETTLLAMDSLLTLADYLAGKIAKWTAEGEISVGTQVSIQERADAVRAKVGKPPSEIPQDE